MARNCGVCGADLGDTERFCGNCGASTSTALQSAAQPVAAAPVAAQTQPLTWAAPGAVAPPVDPAPSQLVAQPSQPSYVNQQTVNVNTNIAMIHKSSGPSLFVRALWFVFIGWWLGYLAIVLAYLLLIPIITIPLSIGIINRLPQVMTLRPRTKSFAMSQQGDTLIIEESTLPQRPWWQRILYLVFVGWWFGAIWLSAAWFVGVLGVFTLGLTLPVSFWMFNRAGAVTSLYRT